jgi:hypothetical protein
MAVTFTAVLASFDYTFTALLVVGIALLIAVKWLASWWYDARRKERGNVLSVPEDVAEFWLILDDQRRDELTERARAAGWEVGEWLTQFHDHAWRELYEADPKNHDPPSSEAIDKRMNELIDSSFWWKPPKRGRRDRVLRFFSERR